MKFYFRYIAFYRLNNTFCTQENLFSKRGGSEWERDGEWGMHTTTISTTNYSSMIWIYLLVIIIEEGKFHIKMSWRCLRCGFSNLKTINHCEKERKIVCFEQLNFSLSLTHFKRLICVCVCIFVHPNFHSCVFTSFRRLYKWLLDRSKLNLV